MDLLNTVPSNDKFLSVDPAIIVVLYFVFFFIKLI